MKSLKPYLSYAWLCVTVQLRIALDAAREAARRSYLCYLALVIAALALWVLPAGLWRHAVAAWHELQEDLKTIKLEHFTRAYWERLVRLKR